MIIIATDRGRPAIRIKLAEGHRVDPSVVPGRYRAAGYRWIKSRQKWSSSCLLHSFTSYEIEAA